MLTHKTSFKKFSAITGHMIVNNPYPEKTKKILNLDAAV